MRYLTFVDNILRRFRLSSTISEGQKEGHSGSEEFCEVHGAGLGQTTGTDMELPLEWFPSLTKISPDTARVKTTTGNVSNYYENPVISVSLAAEMFRSKTCWD